MFVKVIGARQNNLQGINVEIPLNQFVVFTGVSGSGKSSLAFGTIYAEAQRRYFDSIAPYARRLIAQLPAPRVTDIQGLPPAVALKQRRAEPTARSSVGTLTKISNSLRMLFSRAGDYPEGAARLDSDAFSPNTLDGACPTCHGIGIVHTVTESSLVPDPTLTIREKAIAAWPGAWQGKNYRDILSVLGYDVDKPWKDLPQKERDWILFTEEKPVVTVHAEREAHRIQRPYQGTYMSAAVYVRHTFATTNSATLRKRASRFMEAARCSDCGGKRLRREALAVKLGEYDIAALMQLSLHDLAAVLRSLGACRRPGNLQEAFDSLVGDILERVELIATMGLDYLSLDRSTPTLSAGELQRLRLMTQIRSGLFSVVYVLDEPSAGLHPADAEALVSMLHRLKEIGNSLFVVEHEMDIVRQADWIVDIGPAAGDQGGQLLYSGPVAGIEQCEKSSTRNFLFHAAESTPSKPRASTTSFKLLGATRHNLQNLDVEFPLGLLTVVTGVSGSGKSTLVSQVLTEAVHDKLGESKLAADKDEEVDEAAAEEEEALEGEETLDASPAATLEGFDPIKRFVAVDQKPIGRTPRSNLATYTGLFDQVRKKFAATDEAKARKYSASRFSFNVAGGRCETCQGEGYLSVELLFLPSVYSPCTKCGGARYNDETLEIKYRDKNIAEVLEMTVDGASEFFADIPVLARALKTLREVGLGYLHLGQPATELSGGEAQRIKLATELQRVQSGNTLYVLDEPTAGLHPADTAKLITLLHALVEQGNTVIVVEHDLDVVASADWVIDLGPGAGNAGGKIIATGTPATVAKSKTSKTAPYLASRIAR